MRSTLLVSTAALLAGIGLASAQGMQGGGQSGAAPSAQGQGAQGGAAGQERQSPQSSPSQRGGQAQQEPMQKGTTGQAPQRDQGAQDKAGDKAGQEDKAQPQRSGQGQRDQQSPTQAQSPQRQENQQGQSGQAAQGQSQGSKTLTTEQRTTIRNTVVSKGPRATNVNFNVSVGTTVPTSVRVVAVPSTLIEIYPEWRGHMYFIVNDEIIIVDSRHRIVAVLPV